LDHEDIKDGSGEFPGDYKPKFDELGNEEGENASEVENFGNQLAVTENLESQLKKIEWALAKLKRHLWRLQSKATKSKKKDCAHSRLLRLVSNTRK
jgi:hypothetical protein